MVGATVSSETSEYLYQIKVYQGINVSLW